MSIDTFGQSRRLATLSNDIRIADYGTDYLNEKDSNDEVQVKDHRVFEANNKFNKKKLKRTKFNWGMNIVKDIVKSNLVSVRNDATNVLEDEVVCIKEAHIPASNHTEIRCAVKNKHSIMVTVNNDDFDDEIRSKKLRTANLSSLEKVDLRLVITSSENERKVIQNEVNNQPMDEDENDIEIVEVKDSEKRESNKKETQVNNITKEENNKSPAKEEDKQEKIIQEAIHDLFKKTTNKPHIYWAPVITYRVPKWHQKKP